jgi:hypothetical protein
MGAKQKAKTLPTSERGISPCRDILERNLLWYNHPHRNNLYYIFHKEEENEDNLGLVEWSYRKRNEPTCLP